MNMKIMAPVDHAGKGINENRLRMPEQIKQKTINKPYQGGGINV